MEQNKTLIKADIKYIPSKIAMIIYYVVMLGVYCIGFGESDNLLHWYHILYPAMKVRSNDEWKWQWYADNVALVILVLIAFIAIPFIIRAIQNRQCKITALTVTERGIVGSYNNHLNQVSVNMPIEHIDGMTVSQTLGDKIRGGKTLNVRSNSGNMKFHFVQNAEEVVNITMNYINEIKYKH